MTITKTAASGFTPYVGSSQLKQPPGAVAATIYRTLALIIGVVILTVGIGALSGGRFADNFIADEMQRQNITMPGIEAIEGQLAGGRITQDTADALRPHAGEMMSNGIQAKAYASYIQDHMAASGAASGLSPEQATYSGIGAAYGEIEAALTAEIAADNPAASEQEVAALTAKEISDPITSYATAVEAASLKSLRFDTMFNGNMLVGTLLNVYGWGLIGAIATWAGTGLIIAGVILILGVLVLRPRKNN